MRVKESHPDAAIIPPLDDTLLRLTETEKAFLHATIAQDDDDLKKRVKDVQERAYAKYPYPCIRGFHHVNLMMSKNSIYPEILEAGKTGGTIFLDLGCCMGTDVRKLAFDGYVASNILGCDLRQEFTDLGHELYQDKDTCPIRFFTDDIFTVPVDGPSGGGNDSSPPASPPVALANVTHLAQLQGRVDHFYLGALFHLYDEETQFGIALRVATLLKREKGSVAFGRHQGFEREGLVDDHLGRIRYAHSPTSWPKMWEKVFAQVYSEEFAKNQVVVQAELVEGFGKNVFRTRSQTKMLYWSVKVI